MEAETLSDRLAEVKAEALVDALADWPTEDQPETLIDKVAEVKAEEVVHPLVDTYQWWRPRH